jgi:hypothetical protein
MKIITLLFTTFFCISLLNGQKKPIDNQKSHRIEKIIDSQWTFNYFPNETAGKGYESPGFNDSKWSAISLPHSWTTYETTGEFNLLKRNESEGDNSFWWTGWGWYRKHFSISRDYSDRKVFIYFRGVQQYCKVWLNGKYLGDHKGGYDSFDFDITALVKPGEDNLLAVAVNNNLKDELKVNSGERETGNFFSGIYREVTLVLKDKLYLSTGGLTSHEANASVTLPQVTENGGAVRVRAWVKNENNQKKNCTLKAFIIDSMGKVIHLTKSEAVINPGQLYMFDQTDKPIKNFHLWTKEDQNLFRVNIEVVEGKEVTDNYTGLLGSEPEVNKDTFRMQKEAVALDCFQEVYIKHYDKTVSKAEMGIQSGVPAKVVLTCSDIKINADRGSILLVAADIVDSKGIRVFKAKHTIRWTITGPAKLIGPSVYESESTRHHVMEGIGYVDLPLSNVIRSTGKAGKIHISASASGLVSGSLDIDAVEIKPDNQVIIEPVLVNEGRTLVARKIMNVSSLEEIPREINVTTEEINLNPSDKPGYARLIKSYILKNNPSIDSVSIEFNALIDLFAAHLFNNNGHIVSNDYNFNVDHFNNCRLISVYINSTKLPPLYKEVLRKYYANSIILLGSEKNAGDEMNWLNWIPSGGTVVIIQNDNPKTGLKGVIYTKQTTLPEIISAVYPQFPGFSEEAKERALIFISKMNPSVVVSGDQNPGVDKGNIPVISYTVEKGQSILIPLFKFISE